MILQVWGKSSNSADETLPQTPTDCLLCCRLPAGKENGKIKWQASGKKFECEERKKGRERERNGRSDLDGGTDDFSSDFGEENGVLGGKAATALSSFRS